ncbi:hypothetical protein BH09MYX1_BH09MYX1_34820 [soil metagenome]
MTKTEIDWADGHTSIHPHLLLRGYCPCAGCQGHSGTISFVPKEDISLEIDTISVVGNYALAIKWFDGHDTGLYSYTYLRSLCQCPVCVEASPIAAHEPVPRQ